MWLTDDSQKDHSRYVAERAERERHYQTLEARAAAEERGFAERSRRYSYARLLTFVVALALLIWGSLGRPSVSGTLAGAAGIGFVLFAALVVRHARIERERLRAEARREVARLSRARMDRRWEQVPAVRGDGGDSPVEAARASDLDVDGPASLLSFTAALSASAARALLRRWLVSDPDAAHVIRARQQAAEALAGETAFRDAFAAEVWLVSRERVEHGARERFLTWAVAPPSPLSAPWVRLLIRTWTLMLLVAVIGAYNDAGDWTRIWPVLVIVAFAASYIVTARLHTEFDAASMGPSALESLGAMFQLVESLPPLGGRVDALREQIGSPIKASDAIASLSRRVDWSEVRRSAPLLHVPLQSLLLWDFHALFALDDWRRAYGAHVKGWLDALAEVDALSALGAIAHDEPAWAFPLIEESGDPVVEANGIGHPLLADTRRVVNDASIGPPRTVLLVTGSNMAGKSTLLRAFGTNVMLGNAGAPVCATRMSLPRLALATSLRTSDSLAEGVSGYMAGLVRLKLIVDEVDHANGDPSRPAVLYLLDEILAGTNSEERRVAVAEISAHLLRSRAIGAITTHDLALADEPALAGAVRVHFRETVEAGSAEHAAKMTFDYRLRPGLATSTNALALLEALGLRR